MPTVKQIEKAYKVQFEFWLEPPKFRVKVQKCQKIEKIGKPDFDTEY